MNNPTFTHVNGIRLVMALMLATTLVGCVHSELRLGKRLRRSDCDCYAVPGCYGFHSTCWQKWPDECVTCPSPYAPIVQPGQIDQGTIVPLPLETPRSVPNAVEPQPEPQLAPQPMPIPNVGPEAPLPGELPNLSPMPEGRARSSRRSR